MGRILRLKITSTREKNGGTRMTDIQVVLIWYTTEMKSEGKLG
jgi:hypothetical protein